MDVKVVVVPLLETSNNTTINANPPLVINLPQHEKGKIGF